MRTPVVSALALCSGALLVTAYVASPAARQLSPEGLTLHEWGTFTTVAGESGRAIDWFPLGGPTDLPCFVDRVQAAQPQGVVSIALAGKVAGVTIVSALPRPAGDSSMVTLGPPNGTPMVYDYEATRANVRAKVRMETPVLYFYAPQEMTANVRVDFPHGLMTEWYPSAKVTQGEINTTTLSDARRTGAIEWKNVTVTPAAHPAFLNGSGPSHYFAARATDAAPLSVNGQSEKFLFYRGVANFDVPLAAAIDASGRVAVTNLSQDPLPAVILFENQGGRIGFTVHAQGVPAGDSLAIESPVLGRDFASLRAELERALVKAGLFDKEAAAMVDTWRDSWFEEGTRVLYLFAPKAIDRILPLSVSPAPVSVSRVFVGRMEIITPALQASVARAAATNDLAALQPTARFFGPISDRILADPSFSANTEFGYRTRLAYKQLANTLLATYVRKVTSCQ